METPFASPATPGWQVFRDALDIFLGENPTREAQITVSASIEARKSEFIPDDHRDEICSLVLQAGVRSADGTAEYELPSLVVEFLHCQIGRNAFAEMLATDERTAGKWEIVEHDDDIEHVGYSVFTTDQIRFRNSVFNTHLPRAMMDSLFGGINRRIEVIMRDVASRQPPPNDVPEEAATAAAKSVETE